MAQNDGERIAAALSEAFTVDEEDPDRLTNAVDALRSIARALILLGNADAATSMGALEALGKAIEESNDRIADQLSEVAAGLNNIAEAIREHAQKSG